ncbi:polyprenyl synthetase family protein [Actinocrinis puniceicyclus]|uniref:Polyprenyl synthetase family protein n=1 Tax=Actinocrinis puniceicyclus TaxID=977794 RepID=A0A8J7WLE7_9ACTN|nr:polyprenyl synthetase family protein [Actinocrinis puniceicyclus]MBS2962990.1 polyprenyl synthetase family protein [Actinocrinis puniceicyclus]
MKELVDPVLQRHVDGLHPLLREIARFHFGWDVEGGSGKSLRPALAVLGARAAGAAGDEPEVLDAACAVELIHNFSLLHDDIMDEDRTRHHRPTAWTVFGANQSLLAGCALHTLAFEVLARRGAMGAQQALTASVQVLIAGQCDDLHLAQRQDATLEQCLRMEAGKTASLLSVSASLGAIAWYGVRGDLPPGDAQDGEAAANARLLAEYGHHVGMAFQLVDDMLGIWGDEKRTGKPVAADLRARKRSAPVVAALASGSRAGERLAALLASPGELSEEDVTLAAKLVEEAGGRAWCEQRADLHTNEALARLDRLAAQPAALGDLTEVTRFLLRRAW